MMEATKDNLLFSYLDYGIFGVMLCLSALIGLYFGFFGKQKQNNPLEYLLGSKTMKVFPVAISLTATHISAVTVLGVPAEMYRYGTQYWACAISGLIVSASMAYIYLPVFYEIQTTSPFKYLQKRFDGKTRILASGLFTIYCILNIPILIFAPAIAFSQVTGISIHVITPIICTICIFYTTFGGLRAVVWADTLQFSSMIIALGAIIILGTMSVGGISNVFEAADRGGRLIWFNMDPDPFLRSSFWMISVGLTSMWISNVGITPECVQRFLALPTLKDAIKASWIFGIGHIIIKYFSIYNGLITYSKFETCDPVTTNEVSKPDQIFAYYVMNVAHKIPGLPGLFVAGVFSAALSTMSSSMNTLAGTIYVDFMKPLMSNTTEKTASNIMKIIVVVIGVLCLALVYVVEKLGSIFSLAISASGVTSGTMLGLFTLGMVFPKANPTGAFWGAIISIVTVSLMAFGAQFEIADGNLRYPSLPFRTDGCDPNDFIRYNSTQQFNQTIIYEQDADNSSVFWLFRISFMYYSLIGTLIVFIVGYPISLLTGGCNNLDIKLLTPFVRRIYAKQQEKIKMKNDKLDANYSRIETALIELKKIDDDKV